MSRRVRASKSIDRMIAADVTELADFVGWLQAVDHVDIRRLDEAEVQSLCEQYVEGVKVCDVEIEETP